MIFALLLFAIAIWEHHVQKNVPTAVLVCAGIGVFCYGCYLAWLKELQEKEKIISSIETPNIELTLRAWNYNYDTEKDITVFFLGASVLNKGHQTSLINWRVRYEFGADVEYPEMPTLMDSYTLVLRGFALTYTNDDLITVKCRENNVPKGTLMDGRILFTLPGDRRTQCTSGSLQVHVSCYDFMSKETSQTFVPSTVPLKTLLKGPREKVEPIGDNS